jgi:hypothetical protein
VDRTPTALLTTDEIRYAELKEHDLIYLVKKTGLSLPQPYLEFIGKINTASIPTRYPEDLRRAIAEYPEPVARDYLLHTEQVVAWLVQSLQ